MAVNRFYNIKGASVSGGVATTELLAPSANNPNVKSILLTNVHATADATVTLFIQNDPASGTTSTFNILSTVAIPSDTALLLDESSIFTYGNKFGLYITVAASDTVDVMINI